MKISTRQSFWVVVAALLAMQSAAIASFPQLTQILPRGVQRGADREMTFQGARLKDAEEIFFYSDDAFVVRKIEPIDDNSFKATIFIPETCALGEHLVQIRTKSGISDYRSFMVGALAIADEKEPNGSIVEAQEIAMNSTIHGIVENEDVDLFAITATKGQRISVDVEAMRLGTFLFDPYVAILDDKRFELATVDDAPIAKQDGILSILAPADGRYFVQVRETSYGGNGNCRYRLHVGTFPRPSAVYPSGGKRGEKVAVNFLKDASGPMPLEITVGATGSLLNLFATDAQGICPSAIPFRISDFSNLLETEPNDDYATASTADVAQSFNGIIEKDGDVDCFKFGATKGQVFEVECYARRLRSGLDAVMGIHHADGRGLASNDDSRGPDSYLRFTVPEDGQYVIRITDHLGRGQADFVYRVELQPIQPSLAISIPRIDRYSQTRQTIFVPRGNRYAVLVNAARANFAGEILLDPSQLPPGVTMVAQPMNAALSQMPVVFEAAADAPIGGKLITFEAKHADEKTGIKGQFENNADFILGIPNNTVYYSGQVKKLAVAVIDALPYHLEIVQPKAPLVRNGTMNLKVIVKRAEGFQGAITVELPFRSPGVGAGPNVQIPADQNEVIYQINADANAVIGKWPIYVIGQSDVGGPTWVASQMATLDVAEPFTTATLARASCEQGQVAQVVCTLAQVQPFEGEAIARLVGLPSETIAAEIKFTKDSKEIVFDVKTNEKSPLGNHKTPFVEMVVIASAEPVLSRGGSTELQIDAPLKKVEPAPMPAAPAAAAAPVAAVEPPKEKPLTRLEKLRLQGKQAQVPEAKK